VAALLNATQGLSKCHCSGLACVLVTAAGVVVVAAVVVAEVGGLHETDEDRGRVLGPYRYCGMGK